MKKKMTFTFLLILAIIVGCYKPENNVLCPKNDWVVENVSDETEAPQTYAFITVNKHHYPVIIDSVFVKLRIYDVYGTYIRTDIRSAKTPMSTDENGNPTYRITLRGADRGYVSFGGAFYSDEPGIYGLGLPAETFRIWNSANPISQTLSISCHTPNLN